MDFDPFKAISTTLGVNKAATKIVAGAFILMFLAMFIWQRMKGEPGLYWQILAAMAGFSVLMMVLTVFPLMARRLVGWVMALCLCAWASGLTAQVISGGKLPIATASCIALWGFAESCSISTASAARNVAPEVPVITRGLQETARVATRDLSLSKVFVQFATLNRDAVIDLAGRLAAKGWNVQGAAQGGEQIPSAEGLNEVRYFHPADGDMAQALAADIALNRLSVATLPVKDLSATKFAMKNRGHLEVWISQ